VGQWRLKVEVHGLDEVGNVVKRGELLWDGHTIRLNPESLLMRNILHTSVVTGGERITAAQPEKFLRSLCLQYRGGYLQCDEAVKH
jgi:hypothetical protein